MIIAWAYDAAIEDFIGFALMWRLTNETEVNKEEVLPNRVGIKITK